MVHLTFVTTVILYSVIDVDQPSRFPSPIHLICFGLLIYQHCAYELVRNRCEITFNGEAASSGKVQFIPFQGELIDWLDVRLRAQALAPKAYCTNVLGAIRGYLGRSGVK